MKKILIGLTNAYTFIATIDVEEKTVRCLSNTYETENINTIKEAEKYLADNLYNIDDSDWDLLENEDYYKFIDELDKLEVLAETVIK